jgi:hypothetical protein
MGFFVESESPLGSRTGCSSVFAVGRAARMELNLPRVSTLAPPIQSMPLKLTKWAATARNYTLGPPNSMQITRGAIGDSLLWQQIPESNPRRSTINGTRAAAVLTATLIDCIWLCLLRQPASAIHAESLPKTTDFTCRLPSVGMQQESTKSAVLPSSTRQASRVSSRHYDHN